MLIYNTSLCYKYAISARDPYLDNTETHDAPNEKPILADLGTKYSCKDCLTVHNTREYGRVIHRQYFLLIIFLCSIFPTHVIILLSLTDSLYRSR